MLWYVYFTTILRIQKFINMKNELNVIIITKTCWMPAQCQARWKHAARFMSLNLQIPITLVLFLLIFQRIPKDMICPGVFSWQEVNSEGAGWFRTQTQESMCQFIALHCLLELELWHSWRIWLTSMCWEVKFKNIKMI